MKIRTWMGCLGLLLAAAACSSELPDGSESDSVAIDKEAQALHTVSPLNTFITNSIEIDELGGGPGDANLFTGNDPADGTASAQLPVGGPLPFIDWDDLGGDLANHRVLDLDAAGGKDPTSFPRSNECVASSKVLSKMDLTYVAVANNTEFAYFAVQRSNNNGDAGYYWLFTREQPTLTTAAGPCKPNEQQLTYDISGPTAGGAAGDVLLRGDFGGSGTVTFEIYNAIADRAAVPATDAIDYLDATLWASNPATATVAVNTTPTAGGLFGTAGVGAASGNVMEERIFAEAAVPLSVFTGGSTCGATFFGSVITRPSGSGGTNPDLKDLAGPEEFNFGDVSVSATLAPTCGFDVNYEVTITGLDGSPVGSPSCTITFDTGEVVNDCTGTIALTEGTRSASVTASDPTSGCSGDADTNSVSVFPPLGVVADVVGMCDLTFDYSAVVSGGSGSVAYSWGFSGDGTPSPTSSTTASGTVNVDAAGNYTGSVTVTDNRTDVMCTAMDSDTDAVYAPIMVSLAPNATGGMCPGLASDAITYTATVSGGTGNNMLTWLGDCSGIGAGNMCTINPADSEFCASRSLSLQVSDGAGICATATSEVETYDKVTTITASNN